MKIKRLVLLALLALPVILTGCTLNNIMAGLVNQPPVAVIDASPLSGDAPLTVTFDAHYSHDDGRITEYHWDFGDPYDSTPLTAETGTHTYRHPGTYLVKLTVIDNKGAFDSQQVAITVKNAPPIANFSVSTDAPTVNTAVKFDASGSYDPNGKVVSYHWDFGDGTTGTGVKVTHSYTKEGYYVIKLTVTDDSGATTVVRHAVTVQAGSSSGCSGGITDGGCYGGTCGGADIPLAVIAGLPTCSGGKVGVPIEFDGEYSSSSNGYITRYDWTFGDGTTGSGVRVSHTYQTAGRFTVTLTITDDTGATATATSVVSISASSGY